MTQAQGTSNGEAELSDTGVLGVGQSLPRTRRKQTWFGLTPAHLKLFAAILLGVLLLARAYEVHKESPWAQGVAVEQYIEHHLWPLTTTTATTPVAYPRRLPTPLLSANVHDAAKQSAPVGSQFPADSLPNRFPIFFWLLVVEVLGIAAFPLVHKLFPGLHDHGWTLSKSFALLLIAYLTWLPASLQVLPFTEPVALSIFAVLVAVGGWLAWARRAELVPFVRSRARWLILSEVVFVGAFGYQCFVRATDPSLWNYVYSGEKMFELSFVNGMLRSPYFPPVDPWYSGGAVNYYYYGQYLAALLTRLTGVQPAVALNLAVPLIFALTVSTVFGLVYSLTKRWWPALLSGFGLTALGNLDSARQAKVQLSALLHGQTPPAFDYWHTDHIVPNTINEYPAWSFLFGDFHSHMIDMFVSVLVVGCCVSLLLSVGSERNRWRSAWPTLSIVALAIGASWCLDTWDIPAQLLLVGITLALRGFIVGNPAIVRTAETSFGAAWRHVVQAILWQDVLAYVATLVGVLAAVYLLYLPFHLEFQNFTTGIGRVHDHTASKDFLLLFGLWLFLSASYLLVGVWDRAHEALPLLRRMPVLRRMSWLSRTSEHVTTVRWVIAVVGALSIVFAYSAGLNRLLSLLIVLCLVLTLDARNTPLRFFTYLLILLALAISLGVDVVYIKDDSAGTVAYRINTVFKFYQQVWVYLAFGSLLGGIQLWDRFFRASWWVQHILVALRSNVSILLGRSSQRKQGAYALGGGLMKTAWLTMLVVLVVGSATFVIEGPYSKAQDMHVWANVQPPAGGPQPDSLSLDGSSFMRAWFPGDAQAIGWLNTHMSGTPTILEATTWDAFYWQGRVSAFTGLPTPAGWGSIHEGQERPAALVEARDNLVSEFYGTDDPMQALTVLHALNVQYVYLGQLERDCYTRFPASLHLMKDSRNQDEPCLAMTPYELAKFDRMVTTGSLQVAYSAAGVTIYKVVG